MVFESLVVDLINKYLGDYIVKLDKNQLSIGIFGGNVTLENLDIKANAFDEFDLPIKVLQGHIGKLVLKIPWKSMYSAPTIAELDGLYVLVVPNSDIKYDPVKERIYKLESKQKELNRIEENKIKRNEPKSDTKDSFGEKLAAQIVKNLQITINNIHIRYEDVSTCLERPFAIGITLSHLSFRTSDKTGNPIIIKDETVTDFFKSVKMDSLAAYWNNKPKLFSTFNSATLKATMKKTIASANEKSPDITFLIRPISFAALMHVQMKPELTQFSVPRLALQLTINQIGFVFTRNQYCDVVSYLDSIDRVYTKNRYRKYRPDVSLKSNMKLWWKFPYTVILEEQVRRRRRMWSWECIKAHRNQCRIYVDLLEKKYLDKKLTAIEQDQIKNCEEELDLLNITLCRQQAEMKAKQAKKKLASKPTSGGGWFGGWFNKSSGDSTNVSKSGNDLQDRVRSEFNAEEKAKLYEAIGYSEQTGDPDIPKEYVSLVMDIMLEKFSFSLLDESLEKTKLMNLSIHSLSAKVKQRSSAEAISVGLIMKNMKVVGNKNVNNDVPILISTQCDSNTASDLLNIDFETNPIDQSANQKINIRAEPLRITYDSDTVNRIVTFFTPPEELKLYELSTQVLASIEDVKEMTATGLRHLADHRIYTDIKVDIKPSYFILPEGGKYKEGCKMLFFDLGSVKIMSERTIALGSGNVDSMTKEGKLNYDIIKETAYDKFNINLSTIQILMIERGQKLEDFRSQKSSRNHILKPLGFDFHLKKCAISNDANLPKLLVKGCLPHLGIRLSDNLLKSVLDLVLHIPFPQTAPPKAVLTTEDILNQQDIPIKPFGVAPAWDMTSNQVMRAINVLPDSDSVSLASTNDYEDDDDDEDEFQDAVEHLDVAKPSNRRKTKKALNQNLIDLDATFDIKTIQLLVEQAYLREPKVTDYREVMNFIINDVGTRITLKRFDKNIEAYIGSLILTIPQFTDPITKLSICLAKTESQNVGHDLLFVNLVIAEKIAPDFETTYQNTRHSLKCQFKSLEVCLHQESIFALLDFMNSLVPALTQAEEEQTTNWSTKIGDEYGAKEYAENRRMSLEDKKKILPDTSVIGVITSRIDTTSTKKTNRIQALTEAEKAGKTIYIPESKMIQWAINATLDKLRLVIASESYGNIVDVSIHGMRTDMKMSYQTTEIGMSVMDMHIQDPNSDATYKELIWIDRDESIFSMQVCIFNQGTSTPGYELDLNRIDHMVNMNVGKVKIIFLYSFIVRIQAFFNSFQESLQVVLDRAQKYSEVAATRITNVLEEPPSTRTNININLEAPVIYIPENSKSKNALIVDLGCLTFVNEFAFRPNSVIILEKSEIMLSNLEVSRAILNSTTVDFEKRILHPLNINLKVIRNLSWNSNSEVPQIEVIGKMPAINVTISQGDYNMIMVILLSNLGEPGVAPSTKYQVDSKSKKDPTKVNNDDPSTNKSTKKIEEVTLIRFVFHMAYLNVEFFQGDSNPDEWNKVICPERNLTKMKCDNLSLDGGMLVNSSMELSVALGNISLVDTRPCSANRVNELIRKRVSGSKDFISIKFLKDMDNNIKLIGHVAGIYVCICLDYLLLLVDFFIKDKPPQLAPPVNNVSNKPIDKSKAIDKDSSTIVAQPRPSNIEIDFQIERPEILLVEDISNPYSNSILLEMCLNLKYSILTELDLLNGEISDFHAVFCPFKEELRKNNCMDIISPTKLSMYVNKPINNGMQGTLTMEHLVINITPGVIQSVSKIITTLQIQNAEEKSAKESVSSQEIIYINDFWEVKTFKDSDYGFIRKALLEKEKVKETDEIDNGVDLVTTVTSDDRRPDQIYIRMPDIKIILESEVAKKCIPLFIIECSLDGRLKDPSTQLDLNTSMSLSISYFNDRINVWEPLIEVYPDENNRQYAIDFQYIVSNDKPLSDEEDPEMVIIPHPSVSIKLTSHDNLEVTLTKTALNVLTNLAKAFQEAYSLHLEEHRSVIGAPYVIKNTYGTDIVLYLNEDFNLNLCKADKDGKIVIKDDEEALLYDAKSEKLLITDEKQAVYVRFGFPDCQFFQDLAIDKSEGRGFSFDWNEKNKSTTSIEIDTVIVSTTAYLGMKNVEIRSVLQVFNNTEDILSLYYRPSKSPEDSKEHIFMLDLDPGKSYNVPVRTLVQSDYRIFLKPKGLNTEISNIGALWYSSKQENKPKDQILECKTSSNVVYYYAVSLTCDDLPMGYKSEESVVSTSKLDIFTPLAIHNQLPKDINYQSQVFSDNISPGCHAIIKTSCLRVQSNLKISFEHQNLQWFGTLDLGPKMEEHSTIYFKSKVGFEERKMILGVRLQIKAGHASVTIYSPYWMINKTGYTLSYKIDEDYQIDHDADCKEAIFFSFLSSSLFNKKKETVSQSAEKAYLKINNSQWSDKFSLDTVGSSGKVVCKMKKLYYEVAVKINLSSSGLTKIVTFLPYYMILNQSSTVMYCNELVEDSVWLTIPSGQAVPFWPKSDIGKSMMMRCKVEDSHNLVTLPFPFYESHSTLMKLDSKFVGVFVEVQITEEANLINLQLYQSGMALVKLMNNLGDNVAIYYKQYGTTKESVLYPYQSVMYAWQDTTQKRELEWRVEGDKKKHNSSSLQADGVGSFFIHEMKAYWSSFIWENERILIFTNDTDVMKLTNTNINMENADQTIAISLFSIGLSLVNDLLKEELAYISVTHSGVKWNHIRKNRQKPMKLAQSEALEIAYEDFTNKVKVGSVNGGPYIITVEGLEVDLSTLETLKPDKRKLVRVFEPGFSLQFKSVSEVMSFHLRITKVQIDNQMTGCGFPVVFAAFPPPRSVAMEVGIKPLIELSTVIVKSIDSDSLRFKYFRVLIQEMQLMLDQGFVNAMLDFIAGNVPASDEEEMLLKDSKIISETLIETPTIKSILEGGKKYSIDDFHISPIKMHLSFSLTSSSRSGKTALHSDVLNLFLQSVGVVITDMQDVIFKLGYFEKKNVIMPINQITKAITDHYVSQAFRQMYVLILGLDVLGNPFGVIRGISQGVEDLFYEPIRGAVLGPEEFLEGITVGVRSLLGHAVGGAAGAVSRIVGTMGKGIAALTLDADYQKQRREQLAKRPENLGIGLAQGGKGLIFGFVHGVTGVVTKPIDGAKKEGVEGFFKGVGKGLVGVVTRPVSGVVDFASSSFEGIRRVADTSVEVIRVRPPRYIAPDGIIRSFTLRKAEGNCIWNKIKEKSNPLPKESYYFHDYCKRKNVIFLTNERVFHLERNEILGIWSIEWQLPYNKLDGLPVINSNKTAIVFKLKEKQRKLFSKDNITKEIEASPDVIKAVIKKITKIQKLLERQQSFTS